MWQKQTANLAIRANFWQKIKHFNLLETDNINNICCCRILRELESEVTYLPDTIVKKI